VRVVLGALGLAALAFGVTGLLTDDGVRLVGVVPFLAGLVLIHDLVLMPVAIGIGALLIRFLPTWARPFVQGGLFVSAAVTAFALPFVIGAGRTADNPSRFPRPYGLGLAATLVVVWLVVAGLMLRARPRRSTVDPQ
jgi:hypothetical protein